MSQEIENNFEERKKDWDLTGLLDDVIRRYIYQLTNDELNEINLEKASGMPDEEIKNGIKLPLATMQQRRETWGSQSKLDVQEPMIFILQSTVEKLSVGDKIPLSDADSFLIHQESGVLNYELHYLMNGTPQEYNAFLDLSKFKVADTLMDGVTHSTPPALSDYLERHQQLNDTELGAKRLQKLNCDSKNVSYANALLSYVREARECLNSGKQLPQRPTRSSITLEKPNEEVAVPLSEQTPEETAVPDLNSAPEISIPSSNNEEVMQHQNTTPESPEAEHQQAKMENLMDISLPLVDQEPFQEILQALLKNDMSQAANLLQYLGSHLDKLQEEHQKMQVEFRELKEQVNSIDERFFNDSDSVDTVQNNLDQSEKLITLNKSRLANVVLQTKSKLKTAGKNALLSFAEKIHVPKALASLQKGMQHTQDSLDVLFQRLNDAKQAVQDVSNSVKNVGRALTGKELLEYGISQVSAGSCTGVGGYEEAMNGKNVDQFEKADERTPIEVIEDLIDHNYIPSYCTACYRTGRTGEKFMNIAKSEKIHYMCKPNALTTLMEYAIDYGDERFLKKAEKFVREQASTIDRADIKKIILANIDKLKNGERDLYI